MELSFDENEWIDRYLDGQLQGQELKEFVQKLQLEESFAQKVQLQQAANNLMLENGLDELRTTLNHYTPPASPWKKWGFGGALVLVLSSATFFLLKEKQEVIQKQTTPVDLSGNQQQLVKPTEDKAISRAGHSTQQPLSKSQSEQKNEVDTAIVAQPNVIAPAPSVVVHTPVEVQTTMSSPRVVQTDNNSGKVDCNTVSIAFSTRVSPACTGNKDGSVSVVITSLSGSKTPHEYSIDGGEHFENSGSFEALASGSYHALIKDANGCVSKEKEVVVPAKLCVIEKTTAFNPERGETWSLPTGYVNCKLYIYDRKGTIVYQVDLSSSQPEEWNGSSSQGQDLAMGQYLYTVQCEDGIKEKGYITIIR